MRASVAPASRSLVGFADAKDGHESGPRGGAALALHLGIGLPVIGAPLGMTDDDGARARIAQHFGGDVAGEGARRLGVAVLRADRALRSLARLRRNAASRVAGGQMIRSASPVGRERRQ